MHYIKSNNERLAEYKDNLESSINMRDFKSAMMWDYSKELETTLKQDMLIQIKLIGGFD